MKKAKKIEGKFFAITREMRMSEAYKRLSANAVNILIEVSLKSKRPWDWTDDEILTITHKEVEDKIKGRRQFYEARGKVIEWGFLEPIKGEEQKVDRKKTNFRKSVSWKSISIMLKDEKDRAAQSERDKKRWRETGLDKLFKEDDKPKNSVL